MTLAIAGMAQTQTKNSLFKKVDPLPNTNTPKEAVIIGYSANIAAGELTLIKSLQKSGEGSSMVLSYSVTKRNDNSFNGGKPLSVTLDAGSFDALFSQSSLSSRRSQVRKYVADHNLSLSDEKGWVAAIRYYNGI